MKTVYVRIKADHVPVLLKKHHWSKKVTLKVNSSGDIIVTLPPRVPYTVGEQFAKQNSKWIYTQRLKIKVRPQPANPTTQEREQARAILRPRVSYWAQQMNIKYGRIAIRNQKTRWGSCSSQGNLNFNWRLTQLPQDLQDYVIVHELAHRVHMNHSQDFYSLVAKHISSYKNLQKQLANTGKNT